MYMYLPLHPMLSLASLRWMRLCKSYVCNPFQQKTLPAISPEVVSEIEKGMYYFFYICKRKKKYARLVIVFHELFITQRIS